MPNQPSSNPDPPSFEKRLPLALGLMMLVLLASQYFFKPAPSPKPAQNVTPKVAATQTAKPASAVPGAMTPAAGQAQASAETITPIDTELYHVEFTNKGAAVKNWVLKKYKDDTGKPLELIDPSATKQGLPLPFTIEAKDSKLPYDPNSVLFVPTVAADGLSLEYNYSDGKVAIKKTFRFGKNTYLADVKSVVLDGTTPVPHFLVWRGGFGDTHAFKAAATERSIRYDTGASKLITKTTKDAKNGPITDSGNYTFAGLEDNFFATVALPANGLPVEVRTFSDDVKLPGQEKPEQFIGAGISTGTQNDFSLFTGPKDVDLLRQVNPKLSQLIDWGFWGLLAKPLFLWLNWTNDHWTNNYGWAIVVLTVIINLAMFPLRLTSLKSARKMQKIQPLVKAINEKYKNIKINDPRKAQQNQEVMDLYKREGINPLGGCVPMVIQLPFLYAFYRVLSLAIELRHAPWLWVSDLSAPEAFAIHFLPIVLIVTQFLTQRMTPAAGVDPAQQRMMMFMPLMFGIFFYSLPSGLVLYYLTGNLVGIGLQLVINKMMPMPTAAPPPPPPPEKAPVKKTGRR